MKKKIFAILASAAMCMSLCACNNGTTSNASDANSNASGANSAESTADSAASADSASDINASTSGDGDWAYISSKGKLIVGITQNVPMNYYDDNNELVGFETEFTKAVCEKLGVTPDFQEIEWTKKETELKSKTIDLIWNGLTVTEDRKENMLFSKSYMKNKQAVVVKAENAEKYADIAAMAAISIAFEGGSAGEDVIKDEKYGLTNCKQASCEAQKDALLEVKSGTSDACIIDYTMAKAATAEGTDFSDLVLIENITDTDEEYAIGARLEDTETINKINAAIDELASEGKLKEIADKYNLTDALLIGADASTTSDADSNADSAVESTADSVVESTTDSAAESAAA